MSRERTVFVDSGLKGWPSARAELERIDNKPRRDLLVALTQTAGVHGSAGLGYLVKYMRWMVDGADYAPPGRGLTPYDIEFVERKAVEALRPYVDADDHRLHRVRRAMGGAA